MDISPKKGKMRARFTKADRSRLDEAIGMFSVLGMLDNAAIAIHDGMVEFANRIESDGNLYFPGDEDEEVDPPQQS